MAIFLDGQIISAPTVSEAISQGHAVISGSGTGFSLPDARDLSRRLNAGALPIPIELVLQQLVGASLGQNSLAQSLNAGIIGIIIVALFMIIVYRLPGFLSVIALAIYGIILLAVFKYVPVTLTLAGIAGVILSFGMAVDANVLIFERLKEEIAAGKPLDLAIAESFRRAWSSIRAGNLSTLITCFILIWFSTSSIQGFAITLALGIFLSMFTAIVVQNFYGCLPWGVFDSTWLREIAANFEFYV